MKNKNLFIKIMLCVCLCFPATVSLSACKSDEHDLSEKWTNNATYHWHECLDDDCDYVSDKAEHIYDDDNDMTCNTCGYIRQKIQLYKNVTITGVIEDYVYVKQGETAHFELKLSDNYNPDTLKIMNGSTELTWTKADLAPVTAFKDEKITVGTLDVTNVQGHLDLVATAEEATINYNFTASSTINNDQQQILSEFKLKDGKTLYEALTTEGYKYKLSVSEYKNKRIDFTSIYDSEIYSITTTQSSTETYSASSTGLAADPNVNENDVRKHETGFTPTEISKNTANKSFSFTLTDSELEVRSINVDLNSIGYNKVEIYKVSGTLLNAKIYYSETENETIGDTSSTYSFAKDGQIRVTINENANFDLTNIKVWLNNTIMLYHTAEDENDTSYYYLDISKEKSPTYYAGEKAENYEISVTGVTLKADATDVTTVRIDNETNNSVSINGNRLSWSASACYYFDKNEAKMYFIKETEKTNVLILNGCINKLSITANDTTSTIDLTELFKTENGVVGDYLSSNKRSISIDEKLSGVCSLLKLGNCNFELSGVDANKDGKFTIDEIVSVKISLISDLPNNVTITILG